MNMIEVKVAIIDDEKNDLKQVHDYFQLHSTSNIQYNCDEYETITNEFYYNYDLYVLDIELKEINGLDIAKEIKIKNPNAILIINSKRNDLVFESFKFGVFFFIRKDHFEIDMSFAQTRLNEHFIERKKYYAYQTNKCIMNIPYQEIVYVEKIGYHIEIHLNNGEILQDNKSLKEFSNDIQSQLLIPCHQSFFINLSYVKRLEDNDFILEKCHIPISRRYMKQVKTMYIHYLNSKV